MRRAAQSGISLIEILVAIAIVGLLFALGLPAYSTWIQNTQIRTAAESVLNGLQTAKNEAIQRNVPVQFRLDNATNTQWSVNLFTDPTGTPLRFRPAEEGSPNATVTFTPADANTVTFSSLGQTYTAIANGTSGRVIGFTFTINEQNLRQTTAAPAGWAPAAMPANCFVTRKGSC